MPITKAAFEELKAYIPEGSFELVMPIILEHKVHLIVTRVRATKHGDYRNAHRNKNHRITVNGNLNRYSFLITLLHELAHLLAYEQYGLRIAPHGREWKHLFGGLLSQFMRQGIFPDDIKQELEKVLHNPAATTSGETELQRILMRYDDSKAPDMVRIEQVADGAYFLYKGELYQRGKLLRKRIKCKQVHTNGEYLFNPLCEVVVLV